jgi:hypothetical protein
MADRRISVEEGEEEMVAGDHLLLPLLTLP